MTVRLVPACGLAAAILALAVPAAHAQDGPVLQGAAAYGDYTADKPGLTRRIRPQDMPPPNTEYFKFYPKVVASPAAGQMQVPPGFTVAQYGEPLEGPRALSVAPNGDVFVAETRTGRVRVLRPAQNGAAPALVETFAEGLDAPFGIVFYPAANPQWVYVAENNAIKRFAYRAGDLKARGAAEVIVAPLSASTGGHTTRDLAFTADGKRMLVAIGSQTNVPKVATPGPADDIAAFERANGLGASGGADAGRGVVLSFTPDGKDRKPFAQGLRNCVDLMRNPATDDFYCTVNERDALGNNLVPDYFTRVKAGGFYGWPWFYITGRHPDPRIPDPRPDLADKVTVPDVLFQSHSAPIGAAFYPATMSGPSAFPAAYRGDAFVALHGSQNRDRRTGHKIVRILLKDGVPTGEYQDFVTGLVLDDKNSVLGRPSGIAVMKDGSLLFSDDVGGRLWRVAYTGR
jgi:glucose/arabinose dehydrogenase